MTSTFPFVGRGEELALLDGFIERAAAGVGESVLLFGEPGVGKSRLVEEGAGRARAGGFVAVWGRCWEAGGAPEFWPWTQALRALVRGLDREWLDARDPPESPRRRLLARIVPELGAGPGRSSEDGDRFELLDAIASWLTSLASEPGPAIWIGLEDLHAADAASLALLEFLAPQLRCTRILVIGTARDGEAEAGEVAPMIRRVARCSTLLQLRRLDGPAVRRFLAAAFERPLAPEVERAVELTTEGNALFLVEAARLLQTMGPRADLDRLLPATVRATLEGRLAKLDASTRAVLERAAAFGREFEAESVRAVFELEHVDAALLEAGEAAIVAPIGDGGWRFSHMRIPEVLALNVDASEAQRRHAAIAEHLEARGARPAELAHHLLLAGPSRREAALAACRHAAATAHRHFAYEDASAHLERARALLDELVRDGAIEDTRAAALACDLDTADGLSLLASGALEVGRERCERAFTRATKHDDGPRMAEAALAYGSEFNFAHVDARLVAMLEAVLARLPPALPALEARVLARLAAARQPAFDPSGPIELAHRAIAMARECGDEDLLVEVLRNGGSAMVGIGEPAGRVGVDRELFELARRHERRVDTLRALTRLIFSTFELGRFDEAWSLSEQALGLIDEFVPRRHAWRRPALQAMRALWVGELEQAAIAIAEVEEIGDHEARVAALFQSTWLAYLTDDRERIAELAERMRRVFQGSGPSEYFSLIFYAENLVWLGRVDEARALLTDERVEIAARIDDRTSVETLAVLAHACEHQGLARVILDQLAAGSQRFVHNSVIAMHLRGPIDHSVALAHATLGQHEQAIAALKRAIACTAELGGAPVLAHLQRLLARWTEAAPALEPSSAAPIPEPAEVPQLDEHGATWTLRFGGRSATVRASKGLAMLAELLRRPGVEVHVLDLVHGEGDRSKVDEGDAGELLDAEARAAYRRRAEALREEIGEAEGFHDLARAEALRAEFDALADELSRGVGLSGASRRAAGAAERARVNVRKRLRHAIQAIAEVHPELGRHLDATVRTGIFCEYRPL